MQTVSKDLPITTPTSQDWLSHPGFLRVRKQLVQKLQAPGVLTKNSERIVFVCGKVNSEGRSEIIRYLSRHRPDRFRFFQADDVWSAIANDQSLNALQVEERLAHLADAIIIIVESAGSIAELGAFSMVEPLRKKLLPVLPQQYESDQSFINTGPIRWIDKDSKFRPPVFGKLDFILGSIGEISKRLEKASSGRLDVRKGEVSDRKLLYFLCDLVAMMGPATSGQVESLASEVFNHSIDRERVVHLLGLGVAMKLLKGEVVEDTKFFLSATVAPEMFYLRNTVNPEKERAIFLSALLRVPSALKVILKLEERGCFSKSLKAA